MKKLGLIFAVALFAGAYLLGGHHAVVTTSAQEDPSVPGRLERKLKEKERGFKFQARGTGGKSVKHQWRSGKDFVTVTISENGSPEEAAESLRWSINNVSMGVVTPEPGLGDEAYLVRSAPQVIEKKGENVSLIFRQGNVLITINSTAGHLARRFAKHMGDELKVKK